MGFRYRLLLLCFLLSGTTGLIYQIAWSQQFAQVFGASELAVATVLATFMGGLALGAWWMGRRVETLLRPIRLYALLEVGVGISALLIPLGIETAARIQVALFGHAGAGTSGGGSALFHLLTAACLLLLPTLLMGATLPLLARVAVRTTAEIAPRIGQLYGANTLGAAVGALLASHLLLPTIGLDRTVWTAVALNGCVVLVALQLSRGEQGRTHPLAARVGSVGPGLSIILPLTLLSGVLTFSLEVLWTRLLTHLLGSSLQALGTLLGTYLMALAIGGYVGGRLGPDRKRAASVFVVAQLGAATTAYFSFVAVDSLSNSLAAGRAQEVWGSTLVAAAVLLPSALFLGASFPAAVRVLADDAKEAAWASSRVLAWNTAGAILGSLLTGFVLLPMLRFEGVMTFLVVLGCATAILGALLLPPRGAITASLALVLLAALAIQPPPPPLALLRRSALGVQEGDLAHYRVGRTASVLLLERPDGWRLTTNGLPEALIQKPGARRSRQSVPRWLGGLASVVRPEAKDLLFVGLGGGTALEGLPSSIESVDVVELEPEVEMAIRTLSDRRFEDPLQDPRMHVLHDDARSFLRLTEKRYDAILSQPSHPWTSGSSHLFTEEFFSLVHQRLEPGGVLVQWIGLAFVDEDLLRSLLATLNQVFSNVELYLPPPEQSLLFVASDQPLDPTATAAIALDNARSQWGEVGVVTPLDLRLARIADAIATRELSKGAAINTDGWNRLQGRSALLAQQESLLRKETLAAFDRSTESSLEAVSRLLRFGSLSRASALASEMPFDADGHCARALVDLASGRDRQAESELRKALQLQPNHLRSLLASLALYSPDLRAQREVRVAERWDQDPERALVEASRSAGRGDWNQVARLEPRLAAVAVGHPLAESFLRLRVEWRLRLGVEGDEALRLADRLLAPLAREGDLLLRAEAAVLAEDVGAAIASLDELSRGLEGRRVESRLLKPAYRLAKLLSEANPQDPGVHSVLLGLQELRR
ncbi:MAG: fused MFS/spermidine synthase [Thermoanaerobaculia bacterium]|nr:fused MFS/spermidine synthase [Thermoanaerobaculia bacterium]